MLTIEVRAPKIIVVELVGKAVVLTNGIAGTVEEVWPDERDGRLHLSIRGHDGPVRIGRATDLCEEAQVQTTVVKRSIVIGGHKTSVSIEDPFWGAMKEIAGLRSMTLSELVSQVDTDRGHGNLSSAIRLFVLDHYRSRAPAHEPPSQKAKAVTASLPSR